MTPCPPPRSAGYDAGLTPSGIGVNVADLLTPGTSLQLGISPEASRPAEDVGADASAESAPKRPRIHQPSTAAAMPPPPPRNADVAAEGVGASMGATAAASGSVADARGATEGSTAALDGPMLAVPSAPHPPSSLRKKRPPGATDLRCAPAAAATSGSECKGSSSSPALSGLQSAHLQTLLDSPRALSSFAAQLSPRLAEMYGVDFGAFLFDES